MREPSPAHWLDKPRKKARIMGRKHKRWRSSMKYSLLVLTILFLLVTASLPAATLLRSALPCDPSWALSPLPDFCPSLPLVSSVSVFGFWVTAENSPWKCDRKRGTLERMNINDLQKDCNAAVNSAAHRLASGTNPILCPRHWEL